MENAEKKQQQQPLLLQSRFCDGGATFLLNFSVFIAVCGSFVAGCAMGYSSPVQSEIMGDLELSTADYSLFGSMLTLGGLLGSLVCGKLTDCISRKGAMGLSNILFLIGWLVIAFSKLVTGFASGITLYVVPIYIAEITPRNLRGGYVLLQQLMLSSGIALSFIVGLVTTWRILALIGAFPCMIHLFGLIFIPESPRWLVKVGRDKRYKAILQSLRGKDVDISVEAFEIKEYIDAVNNISEDGLLHIFQRKYAYALIIIIGLVVLTPLTGTNGMLFYATTIFKSAGASATVGTVTMALIQLPLVLVGVFLMDNYGRRPILLGSLLGMFIGCLSVAVSFFLKEHDLFTKFSPYLAFTGILVYGATYPVGMGGVQYIIMSEIFPMNVKGAAGSLATTASGCSGWIVSYAFNFMMDWSSSGTFFIFTSVCVFSLVFVYKLVPETKGRTLEEIQESITHTLL